MAVRKPIAVPWNTWIDELVRQAEINGEFDNLPGKGQPIPDLDKPYDEMWWVKSWMKREGLQHLPEALQAKLDLERSLEKMTTLGTEDGVRREARRINARIVEVNRFSLDGPPTNLRAIDVEQTVADWRSGELDKRVAGIRASRCGDPQRNQRNVAGHSSAGSSGDWLKPIGVTAKKASASVASLDPQFMRWAVIGSLLMLGAMIALVVMLAVR